MGEGTRWLPAANKLTVCDNGDWCSGWTATRRYNDTSGAVAEMIPTVVRCGVALLTPVNERQSFSCGVMHKQNHFFHIHSLDHSGYQIRLQATKPGLSSYENDPKAGAESLEPLLRQVEAVVPKHLGAATPLILEATTGLRLLPNNADEAILDSPQLQSRMGFCARWERRRYQWVSGHKKIPDILYPDNGEVQLRRRQMWSSLPSKVRELDANIRWDDIDKIVLETCCS
ncbi:hypothetical protein CASFOL_018515 [Castilleja foliolosa]|uniref:Uncharacterized protein n=1 Tax=Castilleja foliolosa TaxID=1961234 RepID=A0ABD3D902_9LAMI